MTADEMLASYFGNPESELTHFNPNHDPRNGQFAKSGLGRAIERHRQNKTRTDDYERYKELSKRNPKSLTNEELDFMVKRKELEKKAKGKSPAREAAEAEMARFAVKTIGTAVVLTSAAVGANYLRKKYDITLDKVAAKAVSGAGKFTSTVAKETASAVTKAVKDSMPTVKETAKEASKAVGKTAVDALAAVGNAEIKAANTAKKAAGDAVSKIIDAGSKTKTIKTMSDALSTAENAGRKVSSATKSAGKSALDAMAAVGDVELKAIDAGKQMLKKFGIR
ncbi:MAG: hypothetical protein J6U54_09885 [Clostridiales bacterium]|nr:hypothetical protein [Clostridiales bacterium]